MENPRYWEKTVEYKFVIEASTSQKLDFAAPLSGKDEHGVGDAIFGKDESLILIEFKVDESELKSEQSLFHDFNSATSQMFTRDAHHFLVFASNTPSPG